MSSLEATALSPPNPQEQLHSPGERYVRTLQKIVEAEDSVPEHLRDTGKELQQLKRARLSQKLGVLTYLINLGSNNLNVILRLQKLQSISSIEAIQSGLLFARKLEKNPKLVSDNRHLIQYFLSTTYRLKEPKKPPFKNRIRGYRDKGTLPDESQKARNKAQEEGWIDLRGLESVSVQEFLREHLPETLFEGNSLYLPGAFEYLQEEKEVLSKLERILLQL